MSPALVLAVWAVAVVSRVDASPVRSDGGAAILKPDGLRAYVDAFNGKAHTHFRQAIPNEAAADWMADNVPLFECPDSEIEEIYHFRWVNSTTCRAPA